MRCYRQLALTCRIITANLEYRQLALLTSNKTVKETLEAAHMFPTLKINWRSTIEAETLITKSTSRHHMENRPWSIQHVNKSS
jgi:hypothetical protein